MTNQEAASTLRQRLESIPPGTSNADVEKAIVRFLEASRARFGQPNTSAITTVFEVELRLKLQRLLKTICGETVMDAEDDESAKSFAELLRGICEEFNSQSGNVRFTNDAHTDLAGLL